MKVLLVDDDRDLCDLLEFAMRRAGLEPLVAHDAPGALATFDRDRPDVVVLDVNLGPWNGFELLQEVRRESTVPVIMLTAHDTEEDKIRGLELGADDYVTKPFGHRELIARVRAQLRRSGAAPSSGDAVLEGGGIRLDTADRSVSKRGQALRLTVTEFRLLETLMRSAGKVVPTRDLMRRVWDHEDLSGTEVIRVTVHRLRRKVEDEPSRPTLLHTLPGVGVMFKVSGDGPAPER